MGFFNDIGHSISKGVSHAVKGVGHSIHGISKSIGGVAKGAVHGIGQGFKGVGKFAKGVGKEGLHLLHTGENAFKGITDGIGGILKSPMLLIVVCIAGVAIIMLKK